MTFEHRKIGKHSFNSAAGYIGSYTHPRLLTKKHRNRRRNKVARQSRKVNRK